MVLDNWICKVSIFGWKFFNLEKVIKGSKKYGWK